MNTNESPMTNRPLPDDRETCEMILRLANPFHLMAWLMVETGVRITDLETMPVSAFHSAKREVVIGGSRAGRVVAVSTGLASALTAYVAALRPAYEKRTHRLTLLGRFSRPSEPVRFADALLFPVGALDEFSGPHFDAPIPSAWFVHALEQAAAECGYTGPVHSNTLRHVCAKRWLVQGLSLAEVNQRLGHRDVMTTMLMAQALQHGGLTFTTAA
mgnify:FL=1